MILLAAVASVVAAQAGIDAHGPAESVPGARAAVVEHEEWGIRTRNVLLAVAALELLGAAASPGAARPRSAHLASAVVGLGALFCLYEAAEHGGEVVYAYAGGVGLQRKDPADVGRLLLAGLYHQAQLDRKAGRADDAAALVDLAARRFPDDLEVQLFRAESVLLDRKDPAAALAALDAITVPAGRAADARAPGHPPRQCAGRERAARGGARGARSADRGVPQRRAAEAEARRAGKLGSGAEQVHPVGALPRGMGGAHGERLAGRRWRPCPPRCWR